MTTSPVVLIDLSSIAYPIWHTSQGEANPNATSQQIVARVLALAQGQPHVAVCLDKGPSFRKELAPSYKANRPEHEAALHHQIKLAVKTLAAQGFPLWEAQGFEADDVIATAAMKAAELAVPVVIVSADKDLLQLVCETVTAKSVKDGSIVDAAAVVAKFGVRPDQIRDYLTLVGDSADNIQGAKGVGPKKAAELLAKYQTLDQVYEALVSTPTAFTPGLATALKDFYPRLDETRTLITLRTDAEVPFADVFQTRRPEAAAQFDAEDDMTHETETVTEAVTPDTALATVPTPITPDVLAPAPAEWERQLEPRSMNEVKSLAKHVHDSMLFSAYGTPQAVLTTILAGRELGMQAMASLRAIHIVEGKPTLSADLIRALILRSGLAKFFRCTERTAERATFETQRGDDPPVALTFTIQEARMAWSKTEDGWAKSGWGKNPADMLVARAGAKLARLVYPDVVHGIYTPEELQDSRDAREAVA